MKNLISIHNTAGSHWVGDGFPVRTLFSYQKMAEQVTPFLLFDHAGPAYFEPSDKPRGVEKHPHRGFETVTIVYDGALEHKDNAGNAGSIGPGDVQWMTAGRGILHEEMHSRDFTARGGDFHVVQLWVNLPVHEKMTAPGYQEIVSGAIPVVSLEGAGSVRVIAGDFRGTRGPARTFTPVNLWDARLTAGHAVDFPMPEGFTAMAAVLKGAVVINGAEPARENDLAVFSRDGAGIKIQATEDALVLILGGAPIDEPVAGYGPFVMSTQAELKQAMEDYRLGRF